MSLQACGTEKEDLSLTIQVQEIVGPFGQSIFTELSEEIKRRGLGEFKNQEAATILWALGTSGEECSVSSTVKASARHITALVERTYANLICISQRGAVQNVL